jgi:hypothetical protein
MARIMVLVAIVSVALSAGAQWSQPSTTGTIYYNGGYVGIGTTTPTSHLTVAGVIRMTGTAPRMMAQYAASAGSGSDFTGVMGAAEMLSFGFNSEAKYAGTASTATGRTMYFYDRVAAAYRASLDGNGTWWFGSSPTNFALKIVAPTASITGATIDSSGRLGLGTTAPAYKLDVNGTAHVTSDLTVDGNISSKFQDVAEWVPAIGEVPPGAVVIVAPGQANTVAPSTQAYDTRVAGVVSARPGVILGEAGPSKVMIATTGRVRVKVDATRLPIQTGDLLVSSSVPGTAMRSEPLSLNGIELHRPGTLIGKALEPLAAGTGEILVLLSLQ